MSSMGAHHADASMGNLAPTRELEPDQILLISIQGDLTDKLGWTKVVLRLGMKFKACIDGNLAALQLAIIWVMDGSAQALNLACRC